MQWRVSYSQTGARTRMSWKVQLIFTFKSVSEGTGGVTGGETLRRISRVCDVCQQIREQQSVVVSRQDSCVCVRQRNQPNRKTNETTEISSRQTHTHTQTDIQRHEAGKSALFRLV